MRHRASTMRLPAALLLAACTSALFTVGGLCDGFSNVFRLCLSIAGNARHNHTRDAHVARAPLSNSLNKMPKRAVLA